MVIVGRYEGVPLGGAAGVVDKALNGLMSSAVDMGILRSALGELFYVPIPWERPGIKFKAVVVAGMGEIGRFSREDLRYLMMNVGFSALQCQFKKIGTVLIGVGGSVMSVERALRATIDGLQDAVVRYDEDSGGLRDRGKSGYRRVRPKGWPMILRSRSSRAISNVSCPSESFCNRSERRRARPQRGKSRWSSRTRSSMKGW